EVSYTILVLVQPLRRLTDLLIKIEHGRLESIVGGHRILPDTIRLIDRVNKRHQIVIQLTRLSSSILIRNSRTLSALSRLINRSLLILKLLSRLLNRVPQIGDLHLRVTRTDTHTREKVDNVVVVGQLLLHRVERVATLKHRIREFLLRNASFL